MFSFFDRLMRRRPPTLEVFVRHCHYSSVSAHKNRFPDFSREKCYDNLLATIGDDPRVHLTFLLDTKHRSSAPHFLKQQTRYPVIEIQAGSEAGSFLAMLDHVRGRWFAPGTILYFLEDDYLHREGWVDVLYEGIDLPGVDYISLFDHRDKYFLPLYQDLHSRIFHTKTCHWRTTPSTTNTYAMRVETLRRDLSLHRSFSEGRSITADHEKFCALTEKGASLATPIPGWSTHVEVEYASPCIDWSDRTYLTHQSVHALNGQSL